MGRITYSKPQYSGGREGWARTVESVDMGSRGVSAFHGDYLQEREADIADGTLVLAVGWEGSVKNGVQVASLYRVVGSDLVEVEGSKFAWREKFLSLLDFTAAQLSAPQAETLEQEVVRLRAEVLELRSGAANNAK